MFSAIGSQTSGMFGRLEWTLPAMLLAASLLFGGCADSDEDLFISEGSLAAPVPLGTPDILGRESTVGTADSSYYIVTVPVNSGAVHTITTSGNTEDIDLYVYGALGFNGSDVQCISVIVGTAPETCNTPPLLATTTANLHIQVKLIGEVSTKFLLGVTD